ncbi:MAG: hypothetical protein QX198_13590 [Methylococcaceae bacterium]|jgi:hypothetical protein
MKQAINFRLDEVVLKTIAVLAQDLHTSKTDIVEQSVLQFAAKINHKKNKLLQFAGTLSEDDANDLLNVILQDKTTKDVEFSL